MSAYVRVGNLDVISGKRPYIMGILNVTPDSFSDGGTHEGVDEALKHTERLMAAGADIIDVGGESTRPGYTPVPVAEEIRRTCFVIEAIKEKYNVPVSLDTYKPEVAEAGILAGADMINDIWGLKWDDRMAPLIAKHKKAVCIMHNRKNPVYSDLITDVVADLAESISIAKNAGIPEESIMLDPGIGFAKDVQENLQVLNHLEEFTKLDFPVLLGTSRKSVIGETLKLPVTEREEGTVATNVMGFMKGCAVFRVHNVQANRRALDMAYAITREK